ncbi:Elongation factor, GTP-binding domain-containing protein [Rozella allomycis CSF55]|uniref:Elongation factor, GTP-binding domain-containing protein n=1 Tax=Rozella allomycis (strain CSF55) TaxID=988480 RepID=A0A075AND4_ROZAC|nr:Elongation factor, GTP-binding domain-containing protein [Rozella allomycis CSF55]|eukprot:EPZ31332.1 Elongation factor, GTP-binding domain-containing protein [Rozella allomycis CSF55]
MSSQSGLNYSVDKIRNVAIIAHVDHGKTTLVDCLLQQSGCLEKSSQSRVMDSNQLEKERGITILSKCTSIHRGDYHINIVDTPGHADFGGEVERVLSLVDGVILVVDATDGPMTQTRFVLHKALLQGLLPIVVQNKVDRETARCSEVDDLILDLFMKLNANDDQLMYPTLYASAKEGWAVKDIKKDERKDMNPLYDTIIEHIKPPIVDLNDKFSFLVNNLEHDTHLGRLQTGRIQSGSVKVGDVVKALKENGESICQSKISKIFLKRGLEKISIPAAFAGDIVTLAGIPLASINNTICNVEVNQPLKAIPIDPPTLSIKFVVNDSPLKNKEGRAIPFDVLKERLMKEAEVNVAINVGEIVEGNSIEIQGRGELQMGILIETMRREGMEFAVCPPSVMLKKDEKNPGKFLEPIEEAIFIVPAEYMGSLLDKISKRSAEIIEMNELDDKMQIISHMPTRALIGFLSEFKNDTKGNGSVERSFLEYQSYKGTIMSSRDGVCVSTSSGVVTDYGMKDIEERGRTFVHPGVQIYPGVILSDNNETHDILYNPCKEVHFQSKSFSYVFKGTPLPLEQFLALMKNDEMLEITPKSLRLRKKTLDANARKIEQKRQEQLNRSL